MSMMCSNNSCKAKKGMCKHEKMMMGVFVIAMFAGAYYWMF